MRFGGRRVRGWLQPVNCRRRPVAGAAEAVTQLIRILPAWRRATPTPACPWCGLNAKAKPALIERYPSGPLAPTPTLPGVSPSQKASYHC